MTHDEYVAYIRTRFSDLFDPSNSEESWQYLITIGPGWWPLLTDFCEQLEGVLCHHDETGNWYIRQVKEKFGELRIYEKAISAVVQRMIDSRTGDPAKVAQLEASHDRMVAARRRAAVYDGDLDRARPAYYVGAGWHGILDDLVADFVEIEGLGFLAAHDKWGELRVAYLYEGDRQLDIDVIVKRAADSCRESCWYCGQPGRMRQERWWRVRCDEHWSAK